MLLHTTPLFTVYFGDAQDALLPEELYGFASKAELLERMPFSRLKKIMGIDELIFLHQVHGAQGYLITPDNLISFKPFAVDGDYLLTATKTGLGILTADCLPIIFHDNCNNVVMIVHAGWRGSVQKVAVKALEHMQREFKTELSCLRILFGPSAKACCYEVQPDFIQELDAFEFGSKTLRRHGGKLYFDLPLFNRLQLESYGVAPEALCLDYNVCTICNPKFFSCRRQKATNAPQMRQMTVVGLK
jgi:YfiH family protein